MVEQNAATKLCSQLLMAYKISSKVDEIEIQDLKVYKSGLYGFCNVYSFRYMDREFLISDDYSLMDNPKYIIAVFADVTELRDGKLIKNPIRQSDGARYALGLDGTEYYLWKNSLV